MSLPAEMHSGDTVRLLIKTWQLSDGVTVRLRDLVVWSLELYVEGAIELPDIATHLVAEAVPVSFGSEEADAGEHLAILRSGPLSAYLRSPTPLAQRVEVMGILAPDWYDRTHPQLPATRGCVTRLRMGVGVPVRIPGPTRWVPGSVRFSDLDEASSHVVRDDWDQPGAEAQLGVMVDLRLEDAR